MENTLSRINESQEIPIVFTLLDIIAGVTAMVFVWKRFPTPMGVLGVAMILGSLIFLSVSTSLYAKATFAGEISTVARRVIWIAYLSVGFALVGLATVLKWM